MGWLLSNWDSIVTVCTAVVTAASVVTRLTPTPKDDEAVAAVRRFLGRVSLLDHKDAPNTVKMPGKKASSRPPIPPHSDDMLD